jgi:glycosyltransferase involved in cell wall biosynthesis
MHQDKLKIVFLNRTDDIYAFQRIKYLLESGQEVYSILLPGKPTDIFSDKRLTNFFLKKSILVFSILKRFLFRKQIDRILTEIKPDVFHVISALNLYYCKSRIARVTIIENQGSDVILLPGLFPAIKIFYRYFYRFADGIVQDSDEARLHGINCGASDNPNINKVVDIGIDFNLFNNKVEKNVIRKKFNIENRPLVFSSRSFKKIYNIDVILKSLAKVKEEFHDVVFLFTNSFGNLNNDNINYIKKNDLKGNVLFCGFVNHDKEIMYYYRDADVVISVPSTDSSPASVYESIACYTPVIVSDLPWFKDKFIDGKDIFVVPSGDHIKLTEKIIAVLKNNIKSDLNSAYNKVYNNMNYKIEGEKLLNFYRSYHD